MIPTSLNRPNSVTCLGGRGDVRQPRFTKSRGTGCDGSLAGEGDRIDRQEDFRAWLLGSGR